MSGQVWAELGGASKLVADALGPARGDAKSAVETFQLVTGVTMGPEFERTVEGTAEKAILRTTECVWWNRQKELGVSDLCSVACPAYCNAFAKSLNPKITVSLTKAMPRGDPYCEHVWELEK
jgi:hypothetical protein